MPTLQIRNLPEDLYQALVFRAQRAHRSLAQQTIADLREVAGRCGSARRTQVLDSIRASIEAEGTRTPGAAPETLLRDDRDR